MPHEDPRAIGSASGFDELSDTIAELWLLVQEHQAQLEAQQRDLRMLLAQGGSAPHGPERND